MAKDALNAALPSEKPPVSETLCPTTDDRPADTATEHDLSLLVWQPKDAEYRDTAPALAFDADAVEDQPARSLDLEDVEEDERDVVCDCWTICERYRTQLQELDLNESFSVDEPEEIEIDRDLSEPHLVEAPSNNQSSTPTSDSTESTREIVLPDADDDQLPEEPGIDHNMTGLGGGEPSPERDETASSPAQPQTNVPDNVAEMPDAPDMPIEEAPPSSGAKPSPVPPTVEKEMTDVPKDEDPPEPTEIERRKLPSDRPPKLTDAQMLKFQGKSPGPVVLGKRQRDLYDEGEEERSVSRALPSCVSFSEQSARSSDAEGNGEPALQGTKRSKTDIVDEVPAEQQMDSDDIYKPGRGCKPGTLLCGHAVNGKPAGELLRHKEPLPKNFSTSYMYGVLPRGDSQVLMRMWLDLSIERQNEMQRFLSGDKMKDLPKLEKYMGKDAQRNKSLSVQCRLRNIRVYCKPERMCWNDDRVDSDFVNECIAKAGEIKAFHTANYDWLHKHLDKDYIEKVICDCIWLQD